MVLLKRGEVLEENNSIIKAIGCLRFMRATTGISYTENQLKLEF